MHVVTWTFIKYIVCAHSVIVGTCLLASVKIGLSAVPLFYTPASDESPMAKWNRDALVSLQGELKLKVIVKTGLSDRLQEPAGGFMNGAEAQAVESKPSNAEQMGELIRILLGKRNKDFQIFCNMLRQCNYGLWANQLEKKAGEFKAPSGIHICLNM